MNVPSLPSLLGVFAHPDDESLLAGGVLAQHHSDGARTAVVTATWAPGSRRAPELVDALNVLSAGTPRLLGYNDARNPEAAPGRPRLVDAPLDEVVGRLVTHIRGFRPDVVVGHDALGQLTGHPDHVRAHQVTLLAVEAAGLAHLYPDAGPPWQPTALYAATHPESGVGLLRPLLEGAGKSILAVPDSYVTTSVDVTPWADMKWRAILAHRGEVARERSLPGILARLPEADRDQIIRTEHFTRLVLGPEAPRGERVSWEGDSESGPGGWSTGRPPHSPAACGAWHHPADEAARGVAVHHLAAPAMAIFLPDSGSLPPWVGIVLGAVVLAVTGLRVYRLWRSWRRRR